MSAATARFVAEHRGDLPRVAAVLAQGLRLKLFTTTPVAALLFLGAPPIADAFNAPELVWPLRGIAVALAGQSLMALYANSFVALGRTSINLGMVTSESAIEAGMSVALVLAGAGATGAAFGRAGGYLFGGVLAIALAVRLLGRRTLRLRASGEQGIRRIARYAGALFIIDGAFTVLGQIDVLLIGALLTTAAVGMFQAPLRLTTVLHYPGLAVAAGIAPRLARGPRGRAPNVEALTAGVRLMLVLQAAIVAPIVVWAGPITELLLGSRFDESADVLRALAPFIFLSGLAPLLSNGVDYLGEARRRIPIALATLAVNFAFGIIFIPKMGIVAGALGTDLGYLIYVPGHFWLCNRLLGLPVGSLGLSLLRSLVAGAAMAGVLLAIGTADLALHEWLLGAVGGTSAYLFVLWSTRELTSAHLREVRSILAQGDASP